MIDSKIEDFLEKYRTTSRWTSSYAASIAYFKRTNNTLYNRLQEYDVQSGLASSMLQYRSQLDPSHDKHYASTITFNAPWAGAYIDVEEDGWGYQKKFDGDNVLYGARIKGEFALTRLQ